MAMLARSCASRHLVLAALLLTAGGSAIWTIIGSAQGAALASIPAHRWLLLLVVAPVLEEFVFRGFLQPWMQDWMIPRIWARHAAPLAIVGSSLVFALCHLWSQAPVWAAMTFFPSLALGWLRMRGRSLMYCAAVHALFNLIYLTAAPIVLTS